MKTITISIKQMKALMETSYEYGKNDGTRIGFLEWMNEKIEESKQVEKITNGI